MNQGTSILAKLKNKAKASGISYQHCLQLFFQEEFLRRLSKSRFVENFVLKGGLYIYTLTGFESRATVDIDFLLRKIDSAPDHIDEVIAEILATPTGYNHVVILEARKTETITPHRQYQGVSTQIIGRINNVRVPFNIDIGVGDVIIPSAEKRQVKTQLPDYESPDLMRVFKDVQLVEHIGSGIPRILKKYDRSIFKFTPNFLRVTFAYPEDVSFSDAQNIIENVTESLSVAIEPEKVAIEPEKVAIVPEKVAIEPDSKKVGLKKFSSKRQSWTF